MRLANDILDLFSRVADGVQSEDDERRLVALLKTDAAAREAFQRVMELHSTLHWMYVTAAIRPQPRSQSAGPSQTDSASGFRTRWIAAALASVLVLGGVVGGIATRLVARRQPAPAAVTSPAAAAEDRASGVIGVIGMIEKARLVVPAAGGKAVHDGDPVHAGRLAIAAGVVELRLGNGVRIVLEGPGELELFGEMAAFLHAGKAVVRMPEGMKGFRLDTATTDVLDLGTEFAVKTGQGLITDVQVYDGEVLATRKSGDTQMLFPKRLVPEGGHLGLQGRQRKEPGRKADGYAAEGRVAGGREESHEDSQGGKRRWAEKRNRESPWLLSRQSQNPTLPGKQLGTGADFGPTEDAQPPQRWTDLPCSL